MVVRHGNCTTVTLKMNTLCATAVTAVFEGLLCLFCVACTVLVVYAYLLKFGHKMLLHFWA